MNRNQIEIANSKGINKWRQENRKKQQSIINFNSKKATCDQTEEIQLSAHLLDD